MVFLDKIEFEKKCSEVIDDVKKQELRSTAWGWMGIGAVIGFVMSCVKTKRIDVKPMMAGYKKTGEQPNGKHFTKRDM